MEGWTQTLGAGALLGIAAAAIALILILVIVFKMHAFLTLVLVSLLTAFATGIPVAAIVPTLVTSFGTTLGSVALLIGLGAMLGKMVEHSGGARVLAEKMVDVFGEKRAPLGLGLASLIMGFPIFFDAGLVVMLPIIFAVARRLGNNVLLFGMPAAAAFSVMHVFVPPHPGPVAATELYGANIGLVLLIGVIMAFPLWYLTGYLWGTYVGRRYILPVPALFGTVDEDRQVNPPGVGTVIAILLLPLLLIFLNTGLDFLDTAGVVDGDATWVQVLSTLGTAPVALLISVLVAIFVLGSRRGEHGTALEKVVDSALGPVCSVILITGAGGMFGGVLRTSGIGDALSDSLADIGLPVIVAAYVIAVVLRVAQGSATVALVTAAGLMAPAVAAGDYSVIQIVAITLATAAGSVFASHVNDSGFWLVGRLMGMDVKTTLKTWTVQQTLESIVGFLFTLVIFWIG
ncbi:GntP family permease [Georgenia yuyongxinii]|uniref:GntP family permease n=1 Tax=Georgenia yuyongxinii TaxID=2589797 RepID=A0A5B8C7L3_9MICO|nr:GntP family permease [Georgenia yuyongxinii]QDC26448.1 GntP family permease [Georgenia yuyongxinii]